MNRYPRLIHDRPTWMGNNAGYCPDWIHLVDMTGDKSTDIVIDNAPYQLGWANACTFPATYSGTSAVTRITPVHRRLFTSRFDSGDFG
jgi:hypothetical protein